MATGRVITGYSNPEYSVLSESTRTAKVLARGVNVTITPDSTDATKFYGDNKVIESVGGGFNGGTLSLTVDGLLDTAENDIYGRTAAVSGWKDYKSTDAAPYVAFGCVVRYISDNVTSYVPVVLPKVRFKVETTTAATQEDTIAFQTQALEATIFENASRVWKQVGAACETEAAAITALEAQLIL